MTPISRPTGGSFEGFPRFIPSFPTEHQQVITERVIPRNRGQRKRELTVGGGGPMYTVRVSSFVSSNRPEESSMAQAWPPHKKSILKHKQHQGTGSLFALPS